MVTAAEFERRYAAESGVAVAFLRYWGRWPEPCDCGESDCQGWQMGHQWEDAIAENALRSGGPALGHGASR